MKFSWKSRNLRMYYQTCTLNIFANCFLKKNNFFPLWDHGFYWTSKTTDGWRLCLSTFRKQVFLLKLWRRILQLLQIRILSINIKRNILPYPLIRPVHTGVIVGSWLMWLRLKHKRLSFKYDGTDFVRYEVMDTRKRKPSTNTTMWTTSEGL